MPRGKARNTIPDELAALWLPPYQEPEAPDLSGGELRAWMRRNGITPPQLALHMGCNAKTISVWCHAYRNQAIPAEARVRLHAAMARVAAWQAQWAADNNTE